MTNATKTLALVFVGSLVIALGATWSGGSASSAALQGPLLSVDTAQVQTVHIERPEGPSVRLNRTSTGWAVAPNDTTTTYPASARAVEGLLGSLPSLEANAVATRQSDKHPRYGVDSTGTQVTLLGENDQTLGQLIVGRTEMQQPAQGQQARSPMQQRRPRGTPVTYLRSPDAPDVYSVERPLDAVVGRSVEDWRDKRIWSVARSEIQQIDFAYPADSSFTIRRAAPPDTATTDTNAWLSAGDTLSTTAVSSLLRTVSSPEADGFAQGMSPDALDDALYTVRLKLSDGSSRALRFHQTDSDSEYLLVADDFPYVARVRTSQWHRSVLQDREAFLEND